MTNLSDFVNFCDELQKVTTNRILRKNNLYPCGHPRTAENSRQSGYSKAGTPMLRCKTCHQEVNRTWHKR